MIKLCLLIAGLLGDPGSPYLGNCNGIRCIDFTGAWAAQPHRGPLTAQTKVGWSRLNDNLSCLAVRE